MATPEGKVKAKVKHARKKLIADGYGVWSFMPVQMGYGSPALDFLWCVNGFFVAIETKKPGAIMTPRQEQTAEDICAAGGSVFIVSDDSSLKVAMKYIRKQCRLPSAKKHSS